MIRLVEDIAVEPQSWVVVFNRTPRSWLLSLLAFGTYKHVSAYAYLPDLRMWLFYDIHLHRTEIVIARDGEKALMLIAQRTADADLIRIPAQHDGRTRFRLGFWCVPGIKHLLGLRSGALRPDRLWRDCIAAGGVPAEGFARGPAPIRTTAARP